MYNSRVRFGPGPIKSATLPRSSAPTVVGAPPAAAAVADSPNTPSLNLASALSTPSDVVLSLAASLSPSDLRAAASKSKNPELVQAYYVQQIKSFFERLTPAIQGAMLSTHKDGIGLVYDPERSAQRYLEVYGAVTAPLAKQKTTTGEQIPSQYTTNLIRLYSLDPKDVSITIKSKNHVIPADVIDHPYLPGVKITLRVGIIGGVIPPLDMLPRVANIAVIELHIYDGKKYSVNISGAVSGIKIVPHTPEANVTLEGACPRLTKIIVEDDIIPSRRDAPRSISVNVGTLASPGLVSIVNVGARNIDQYSVKLGKNSDNVTISHTPRR